MSSEPKIIGEVENQQGSERLIGRVLSGRYEILELAGEGAMGAVYKARQTFMKYDVAVKTLHHEFTANTELVERFQREAQAAAHIKHPNVCSATDFGRFDDTFFLVMEWLDGQTLEALLRDQLALPPLRALKITLQISDALVRAHELEIVHRDLKPANIMVGDERQRKDVVKVTDFGVARVRIGNAAALTQAGIAYGTPAYMAPEQASGEVVDTRADIYALGVILYEMVSGRVPFDGNGIAQVLAAHITDAPPHLDDIAPEVPASVRELTMRCLAKDPDKRPQSATALSQEIQALIESLDTAHASTLAVVVKPARPESNRPWWLAGVVGLVAGIALAVALGVVAGVFVSDKVEAIDQQGLVEARADFARQPEIAVALEAGAKGDREAALNAFEAGSLNYEGNAHFQFMLGSAYYRTSNYEDAFVAYDKAVSIDPRYARDEGIRRAVLESITEKSSRAEAANRFLEAHPDDSYRTTLFERAMSAEKRRDRIRLADSLKDSGQFDELDDWQTLSLSLISTRKCEDLNTFVQDAVAANDKRLIPAIEHVSNTPKKGCGFLKRSDCIPCARDTIKAAVAHYGISEK